jgi:hypothetical protein
MKLTINNVEIATDDFVKKWTDWALEATPATDEQVTKNIQTLYKKARLKKPEVRVFREYDEFLAVDWTSVGDSVRASVGAYVGASVRDSVRDSAWASVGAYVGASVRDSVGDSVRASVGAYVGASVRDSVGDSVWASVRDSVGASVRASVGAYFWADDLAFADVFVATGVLSKQKAKELEEYKKLLETQRIAVLTEDVAYVLVAPIVRRNERGQLHHTKLPAVQWGKSGQYYLNGVSFPKELFERVTAENVSAKDILSIEDIDQRTQALRFMPAEDMVKELKGELLDEVDKLTVTGEPVNYKLYKFPKGAVFTEDAYYVLFDCPSTRKKHIEGFEKASTVAEAMAWAEETTEEDWKSRIPLLHEV